jgi:hypothetical protein
MYGGGSKKQGLSNAVSVGRFSSNLFQRKGEYNEPTAISIPQPPPPPPPPLSVIITFSTTASANLSFYSSSVGYYILSDINTAFRPGNVTIQNTLLNDTLSIYTDSLISIDCDNCISVSSINFHDVKKLVSVHCDFNVISTLDIKNVHQLTYLSCDFNAISDLDLGNLTLLVGLSCTNNLISTLDITKLTHLTKFFCDNNNITQLTADNIAIKLIQKRIFNGTLQITNQQGENISKSGQLLALQNKYGWIIK